MVLILGVILLALAALSMVRLWGRVRYSQEGLALWLGLGLIRYQILPRRPKRAKQKKKQRERQQEKPEKAETRRTGGPTAPVRKIIPLVGEAASRIRGRIRIDQLSLEVTAAAADPARAALAFGGANALIGMILPVLEHNFTVKDREIRTAVDFQKSEPTIYLSARLSMTVGQAVVFALWMLSRLARIMEPGRKGNKSESQKEAV